MLSVCVCVVSEPRALPTLWFLEGRVGREAEPTH